MALLIGDLQWADDDSLRLLRYIVRADAGSPIFLMGAIRPEEFALVTEEGHAPWGAQAQAALARVALARGDEEEAVRRAMSVIAALQSALPEDVHVEVLLPVAEVLMAAGSEAEQQLIQFFLQMMLALTAQRTLDDEVRVRWFRAPVGAGWSSWPGPWTRWP